MRWTKLQDEVKLTPLGVSGFLLELLRDHYKRQHLYSNITSESKLLIELHQQWDPEKCENYPGIYIKRYNFSLDKQTQTMGNYYNFTPSSRGTQYWIPINAIYHFICVGKEYGEIEKILNDVWSFLTIFSGEIATEYSLRKFEPTQISEISLLKEEKNYRIGYVELYMSFDLSWENELEKHEIQEVSIDSIP